MRKVFENNGMVVQSAAAVYPHSFYVEEIGHSEPVPGYRSVNVLSKKYALHFVISGCGRYNGQSISAGDGFLIARNQPYTFEFDEKDPWRHYWIGLNGENAQSTLQEVGLPPHNHVFKCPYFPRLIPEFERILSGEEADADEPCRMLSFFYRVMSLHVQHFGAQSRPADRAQQYVELAMRFVEENYFSDITMEDVARAVNISSRYLYKLFMRVQGMSPSSYLAACRLKKSRILLRDTGLSIDEIARAVGYHEPGYFSSAFKAQYGMTPTAARTFPKRTVQTDG